MDNAKVLRTLREMLPACIFVAAGPPLAMPLTARERDSAWHLDECRTREFESGRAYAKQALAMLGMQNVELPIGPGRVPRWPSGITGSITHVIDHHFAGYFAAAVARTDDVLAVGIDVEREDNLHPHTWPYVFTRRELNRILDFPADIRRREALFLWCAKEATTKIMEHPIDASELEIERDMTSGDFTATFNGTRGGRIPKQLVGRTACSQGLFLATTVLMQDLNEQHTSLPTSTRHIAGLTAEARL